MQELFADGFSQAEIGRKLSLEHNVSVTQVYISRYFKTLSAPSCQASKTLATSSTESTAHSSKVEAKKVRIVTAPSQPS
eukprot:3383485-Karenia_brevis.AAC.1